MRVSKACYGREGKAWESSVHVQFGELTGPGMVSTSHECSQFWDLQLNLLMGKGFILAFWTYSCPPLKPQLTRASHHIVWEAFTNVPRYHWPWPHHPWLCNTSVRVVVLNKEWFYLSGDSGQWSGDIFDSHYLSLLLVFSGWRPVMLVWNNGRCWLLLTSLEERYDSLFSKSIH